MRSLRNLHNMIGFGAGHTIGRKFGILTYMIYFIPMQIMGFLQVGAYYAGIKGLMGSVMQRATANNDFLEHLPMVYNFFQETEGFCFSQVFPLVYLAVIIYCLILSVGAPLDKVMNQFRFIVFFFSCFQLFAIGYGLHYTYEKGLYKTNPDGTQTLQLQSLFGPFMLSGFAMPFILRPIDFITNFRRYIVGLICYLFMLPVFGSVL